MSKQRKLTIGMRCRFKNEGHYKDDWDYGGKDCLLEKRSSGEFSVLVLGQKELKREDPNTVIGGIAWVPEDALEFVDAKFKANLEFMDWHQEHEDEFCGDCGAWFPNTGAIDPKTEEDYLCPNEKCPGRLYDSGICPSCERVACDGEKECPKCGFNWSLQW